jgi:acyl-CoA thioester hydrolase
MIHTSKVAVRYAETDQMGIAHHSVYWLWFEIGRTDFLKTLGFPYAELEAQGILMAVLDVRCRYRASVVYDEELLVRTRLLDVRRLKVTFEYDLVKPDGRIAAQATTVLGCITREGRPNPLPEPVLDALLSVQSKGD